MSAHQNEQPIIKTYPLEISTFNGDCFSPRRDLLAVEAPLEIRVRVSDGSVHSLAVTMRTPGEDEALALGFLWSEGLIDPERFLPGSLIEPTTSELCNVATLNCDFLRPEDVATLSRQTFSSSACGICGKQTLDQLAVKGLKRLDDGFQVDPHVLTLLSQRAAGRQEAFTVTGGMHAAALFDAQGGLMSLFEDIGRHNAVDKVLGFKLMRDPKETGGVLFLSGRAGFELVQKAVVGRIPIVVAVGAPSSLALETAKRFNLTLVGFLRGSRFNVYCGGQRLGLPADQHPVEKVL